MADSRDRYAEGALTPAEARELAQLALDRTELFDDLTFEAVGKAGLEGATSAADEDVLELLVAGKLPPSGQRELAQSVLEDDELFDALAAHGAVETSLRDPAARSAIEARADIGLKVVPFRRRAGWVAISAIAAAAAVVAVYLAQTEQRPSIATEQPRRQTILPSLDVTVDRPVLLASDLRRSTGDSGAPVFRSATPDSRAPRPAGSIVSTDNLEVTMDLGSLDGLTMGVELEVFHAGSPQAAGRLQVTTVFRDRSRARILGGAALRAKEQVRVPAPVYLAAVLQQVEALAGSGEGAKARDMARSALAWADANGAGDGDKRALLERLATLDYQAGDSASAEEHYRRVMAAFDSTPAASAPERDLVLNNLGSLYLLRGDLEQAEARFRDAPTDDAQTLNNLGVVAELRGDREKANTLYSDALRAVQYAPGADARDRQAIEANLARVRKPADAKQ